jgi:hypothetical protein
MSTEEKTIETTISQETINLDEVFGGAPGAETVTLPETEKPNMFSRDNSKADMAFAEPPSKEEVKTEEVEEETVEAEVEKPKVDEEIAKEVFDAIDEVDEAEEDVNTNPKTETRGRKKISGIGDVFEKLIKDDKIIAFDDDKSLDEYSAKDWEELINANLEERANQVRRETPAQFFQSLPTELQIAARYVADGGQDMRGLFQHLAAVEETRSLDVKNERDQEHIIREYLGATGYGTQEEITEEIEIWKDLGKLEQQASKFKPKLDKMSESVVARKLEEQQMMQKQQQQASQQYMDNVYNTLKEGSIGEIKLDRKTQSLLYNGLVQPNYPSVSGKNTNLLGHLLEKYQFVEPNYNLISEALWLLADPNGYKAKIMERGAQASVEKTVRKLKTEQSNKSGSSLGVDSSTETTKPSKRKLPRKGNNIFKRI